MGRAMEVKQMLAGIGAIYDSKRKSYPTYQEISMMVKMAKSLDIHPDQFFDFVGLLVDGKTFEEARDILALEEEE
jgi:nucleoid-associated protein YejK